MGILKTKQVGDKVKFKHRFAREKNFIILGGTIVEICANGVDCYIQTIDKRKYYVGEWLIIE